MSVQLLATSLACEGVCTQLPQLSFALKSQLLRYKDSDHVCMLWMFAAVITSAEA